MTQDCAVSGGTMRKAALIALAGLTSAYADAVAAETSLRPVHIVQVQAPETDLVRTFFGRVAALQTVDLAFQVSGQVLHMPAAEGALLAAGDLIAQLDPEPFELALAEARARAEQAARRLERLERLEGNAASAVTVEDARTDLELARISERSAARALEQVTLRAPFAALIASRSVARFATVNAGTPVVRLHDMSELRVEIDVPEILFHRAGTSPDVAFSVSFPADDRVFEALPRALNAETLAVGQTYRITRGVALPEGYVVLPGASATVEARLTGSLPDPVIPASAVILGPSGSAAVKVFEPSGAEAGNVRRVAVDVAPDTGGRVTVVGGLAPGQEIVASGAHFLQDGQAVRRFTGFDGVGDGEVAR
jgi:RND family efflux transporter MFP subunit